VDALLLALSGDWETWLRGGCRHQAESAFPRLVLARAGLPRLPCGSKLCDESQHSWLFWVPATAAAAFGQLGDLEPARKAVRELLPFVLISARWHVGSSASGFNPTP
jgi:hypothetical protein